jgi:tetratricopeptide (TPR) repeat protein
MNIRILILLLMQMVITGNIWAQRLINKIPNQEFVGARPMSMGETFVAIADDINAIYWNPAGLPSLDHLGINSMHTNLFSNGIGCNYLSLCLSGPFKTSFGVDWLNINYGDEELEFKKNKFNFSGGYKLFNNLSLGLNLKYIQLSAILDGMSRGDFHGWGIDFGVIYWPGPKLKLGLAVHDGANTRLKGIQGPIYQRTIRLGAACQFYDNLLLATDLNDRFHVGAEWSLFKHFLSLRGGLQKDFYTQEDIIFSFGFGLNLPFWGQRLSFDYAFTDTPTLLNTNRYSLSFLIDLFPSLVKINKVEINPVYASFYKKHSKQPIGKVYVEYKGQKDLDCTINVAVNKYARDYTKNIVLRPKSIPDEIQEVSLNTVFNDSILYEPDNIPLTADVQISYSSKYKQKVERVSQEFTLHKRNSINWQYGADQAAAFITPDDAIVSHFAQKAVSDNKMLAQNIIKNETFTKAVCLFNAVSQYGIRYKEDSYSPYSKTYQGFDNVYYPAQLLKEKIGDCDDLCVLFASLLESLNIPSALVSVPGHIFLMFNCGLHPIRAFQLCCAKDQYVVYQNQIWVPLETTWIDRSFSEAWHKGAEVFNQYDGGSREIINVHDAWEIYEPVAYSEKFLKPFLIYPQQNLAQEKKQFDQISQQHLVKLESQVAQYPDSIQLRNELGITYAYQNQIEKARPHFDRLIAKDSTNFLAINNLGNLYFLSGKLDSAQHYYLKGLTYATGKHADGIRLNLGLIYATADQDSMAVAMFSQVMGEDTLGFKKIGDLLGIIFEAGDLAKAEQLRPQKKLSTTTIIKLTCLAERNRAEQQKKKEKKLALKEKKKEDYVNLGRKGSQPTEEIENILYWAF